MQRAVGMTLAVVIGLALVAHTVRAQDAAGVQETAPATGAHDAQQARTNNKSEEKFTFEGDTALWAVAIHPGKTDAFEQVMARVRQALESAADPQRQRQAEGWRVVRLNTPLPDGTVGYVHMIHPVIAGTDYSIMQILYDAFPEERQELYDLYRGAFAKNLSLATGNVRVDLSSAEPRAHTPFNPVAPVEPAPVSPAPPGDPTR